MFYACYGVYTGRRTIAAFMRFYRAEEARNERDAAHRLYVGTGIQFAVTNLANAFGGSTLMEYAEFIGVKKTDTRSSDEIISDIISKCGLAVTYESI